jgi:hypothetical protein
MRRIHQRWALMLGLIPLVAVTAACSSPGSQAASQRGPTHAVTTTRTPAVHEFVSKRYHFRLTLPRNWSGVDAQSAWNGKALQGQGSPAFADFSESGTERVFTFGETPVAKGMPLAAWRAAMVAAAPSACVDPRSATKAVLGGEPALTWTTNCGDTYPVKFAVVHGGRGYVAIFEGSGSSVNAADQRVFDPIRRSFRFTG